MALMRERKRSAEGEGKEEEHQWDESLTSHNGAGSETVSDVHTTDWTEKITQIMQNASPAMTAMKQFITSKEKNPKHIPRRRAVALTPDEAAALDAGLGLPEKEADSVGSDHTVETAEKQDSHPTKLPPRQYTLIAALESVAEEQQMNDALTLIAR